MAVLYLIVIIACISGQNITKKIYTEKTRGSGAYLFSACTSLFSMLFFIVTMKSFEWEAGIIPYSIAFALSFALATLFGVLAIGVGPLSISSLMISYSLMIPTFYGIFFLNEPISIFFLIGIIRDFLRLEYRTIMHFFDSRIQLIFSKSSYISNFMIQLFI